MLIPNSNSTQNEDLTSSLRFFLESFIKESLDDMLPCKVVSCNRKINRVSVQPLVMLKTTSGQKINRQVIDNIPVFRFGGGGFFISTPVKVGDFGWIKANDRDISLIFQSGGMADIPNTKRFHKFNDGLFFPDTLKNWLIDGKNTNALVISSLDGKTCLALDNNRVEIDIANGDFIVNAKNIQFNSQSLKHNTKNIGDTHTHTQNNGNHFGGEAITTEPN